MKNGVICLLACLSLGVVQAQDNKEERSAFWGNQGAYLQKQVVQMFDIVDQGLNANPPTTENALARKLALYNFDAIVHDTKYDGCDAMLDFVNKRVAGVVNDIDNGKVKKVKIYKIYNDGFVAKTKSVVVAFDVVRGASGGKNLISDSQMQQLVDRCDILFLTHNHPDHVDPYVVDLFVKAGKPVIATKTILDNKEGVTHYRNDNGVIKGEKIALANGKEIIVDIFPGHQDNMLNNIYVVTTPEKVTFGQTGDQYNKNDMEWIANAKDNLTRPMDVFMVICWTHKMADLINGFAPKVVVTGHENEMGHTIDHRESFWLTFQKMQPITTPYVVLGWGEGYSYPK